MAAPNPLQGTSQTPQETLHALLHAQCPEIFTDGKVDVEKLKLTLGEKVETSKERYGLSWPGKTDCFRIFQEPTTATLVPDREESKNFDETRNIFIEGDNLEALKILQKAYYGQVKMIYIDPPYNTGNDFIYSDNFRTAKKEYLMEIGAIDEEGNVVNADLYKQNTSDSGHFHSTWLNMMYPRLFLARQLLRQDGVIFVSIDDTEVKNLRAMMDEIFGEENFIANFIWEKRTNRENRKTISSRHDYVMCFCRSISELGKAISELPMSNEALSRYKNPDNDPRGLWKSDPATAQAGHGTKDQFYTFTAPNGNEYYLESGRCWLYTEKVMQKAAEEGRLWFGKSGKGVPRLKTYLNSKERGLTPETIWFARDASTNEAAKNDFKDLFEGNAIFDTPKPVELIKFAMKIGCKEGVVLDFFAGSGSTAHAVMALNAEDGGNRQCISIQLPEVCREGTEARKADYKNIAQLARERIRRAGEKIQKESEHDIDIGFKAFRVRPSNFKIWDPVYKGVEELEKQMELFDDPLAEGHTDEGILYELMLKNGLSLTTPLEKIETKDGSYYRLRPSGLEKDSPVILLCIQKEVSEALAAQMIAEKPDKFMCIDRCFEHDEVLLTNTVLRMEQEGTEFSFV